MSKGRGVLPARKRGRGATGYLFSAHWVLGFLALTLYPLVFSLYMSAHSVSIGADGITTIPLGPRNYSYALTLDVQFIMALLDAIRFTGIITPLVIILSFIIALLLNQPIKTRALFRAIYFFPVIIISGSLMSLLENNGVFKIIDLDQSDVFRALNFAGLGIFMEVVRFLVSNIFTVLWFSGVQILIYLSGMQKISRSMYEAAWIDGASRWQSFWKITLPSTRQFTLINIVYTVITLATFTTNRVIEKIRVDMFGVLQFQGLGYASAMAWIYFIVIVLMLLLFLAVTGFGPKRKTA
ncbi:MAG: sugar ABC transporter permease [Treponema sp.]|jgi:ABC-type sugar transport system permease subunit|nr:sugar ABC transporter permease [Treponema sp.]